MRQASIYGINKTKSSLAFLSIHDSGGYKYKVREKYLQAKYILYIHYTLSQVRISPPNIISK